MSELKSKFNEFISQGKPDFKINIPKALTVVILIIVCMQLLASIINIPGVLWRPANNFLIPISFLVGGVTAILILLPFVGTDWGSIKKHLLNPSSMALIALSIFMYLCLMPFAEFMTSIIPTEGNKFIEHIYKVFVESFEMMMDYKIAGFITICILAPVLEEILFRGILLRGLLQNGTSPIIAIALSSILFGAAHMNPWQFLGAGLLGAIFGFVYYRTRALWICIFLHALNNSISYIYMMKEKSIDGNLTNTNNYLQISIFFFLAVICGWLIYKLTQNKPKWS